MNFYFCETCGKRVTDEQAADKGTKGRYCLECAQSVLTGSFDAVSDAHGAKPAAVPTPSALPEDTTQTAPAIQTPPVVLAVATPKKRTPSGRLNDSKIVKGPRKLKDEITPPVEPDAELAAKRRTQLIFGMGIGLLVIGGLLAYLSMGGKPDDEQSAKKDSPPPVAPVAPAAPVTPTPRAGASKSNPPAQSPLLTAPVKESPEAAAERTDFAYAEKQANDTNAKTEERVAAMQAFLAKHPDGNLTARARVLLKNLQAPPAPATAPATPATPVVPPPPPTPEEVLASKKEADGTQTVYFRNGNEGYEGLAEANVTTIYAADYNHFNGSMLDGPEATLIGENANADKTQGELFLRFDNLKVPNGAKVKAATLVLGGRVNGPCKLHCYYVKVPWVNGGRKFTMGWLTRDEGKPWDKPGGRGLGTDCYEKTGEVALADASEFKLKVALDPEIVQKWLDAPETNQGVLLFTTEPTQGFIYSSKNPAHGKRPVLMLSLKMQ